MHFRPADLVRHHDDVPATPPPVGPIERTLAILEVVAERGGASAREVAEARGLPLATVYRLAAALVEAEYLVHIRGEGRYELGSKLHQLGLSLHRQIGMSRPVAREIQRLHEETGYASYFARLRGAELVLVHVAPGPSHRGVHRRATSRAGGGQVMSSIDHNGYYMETLSLGVPFLASFVEPGTWGRSFTDLMDVYENMAGMWIVGEDMPQESNRVTLDAEVKDDKGLLVPHVHFDDHANDVAMRNHGYAAADAVYSAVGALGVHHTPPYPSTHNLGTWRMSGRPGDSGVQPRGGGHGVPNLFVSDGSIMTTGAAANPTLTIVALAMRQAEHIISEMSARNL